MLKILSRVEDAFCALSLLLTSLLVFVNVLERYVFSSSSSWNEELIRYLMIWITFIGGSVCVRKGAHIRMDFILTHLPKGAEKVLDAVVYAIAMLFCAALFWYSLRLTLFAARMKQTSPAMGLPMWVPYTAMPLGGALMTLRFALKLFGKGGK